MTVQRVNPIPRFHAPAWECILGSRMRGKLFSGELAMNTLQEDDGAC